MRQLVCVLTPKKANHDQKAVGDFPAIIKYWPRPAKLLERCLRHVVGEHQTYGFGNSAICKNLHTMRIIREAADIERYPLAALQLDLSKVFDKVSHSALLTLLRHCGIGEYLINYIEYCASIPQCHLS